MAGPDFFEHQTRALSLKMVINLKITAYTNTAAHAHLATTQQDVLNK